MKFTLWQDALDVPVHLLLREGGRPAVQRLFSMFPNGWPGTGLLLMRVVSGALLTLQAFVHPHSIAQPLQALGGVLLMLGLGTPVAGVVVAVCELWGAFAGLDDVRIALLLAAVGAALAMLGPGSTSIDNYLFGRKRLDVLKP